MESNLLLSIIIPIYNAEKYLERCIESVINQSYKDIEVILVNDGSTDSSLDICNKYAKIDSRIVVVNKSNSGVSQTRNVGLKYAQGQYVQFLDADDYIDRDMCKILIDNILEKKCDLVICGYTNDEIKLNKCINKIINNINDMQDDFSYLYKSFIINSPCNKIYKKELITKYFITDLSLGEDLIFNLEYFKNCKRICFIEDCLYHYITMENSLSVKVRKDGVDIALILYENLYKFCKKFQFEDNNMFVINEVLITRIIDYMNVIIDSNDYTMNEKYRILNKWINNSNVRIACKNYNSSRKSYRMINKLIENKNIFLIYSIIQIKSIVYKLISKR